MKPSMRMAEWIQGQLGGLCSLFTADDVYDVLLDNITTSPYDFVAEVKYWALEYEADFRAHDISIK